MATKREREAIGPADEIQARHMRRRAGALGRVRSTRSWVQFRRDLGRTHDRKRALQIVMAATGYRPLPKQLKLHLAGLGLKRVNKLFCGGIGTGKSYSAIIDDVVAALCNPGTRGLIVAPTYDQALHVLLPHFLAICEMMERAGYPLLKKFRWSQMRAELVCGGEIFFRSVSKVDNLLGFEFAWWHFDECETIADPARVWDQLSGRLRQIANFRQTVSTSTPRGLRGVVGKFQLAREDYKTDTERDLRRREFFFVRATTLENPHLPADYIANLRRTLSKAAWEQEVLAKILRPEAAVYGEFERSRHEFKVRSREEFLERMRVLGASYDLAYDFGPNYSHVLWIARLPGVEVVFDEICDDAITTDRLHDEIERRCLALGRPPEWIVCDRAVRRERAWAAESFPQSTVMIMDSRAEQAILGGISIVKNQLDPMVGEPRLKFASYLWDRMPRRAIVRCMTNYRYGQMASGLLSNMPHKDNAHDHGADALRMQQVKRHGDAYRALVVQRRYASAA